LDSTQVEFDVAPGGGERGEGEAQRVGAEAGDAVGEVLAGLFGDLLGRVCRGQTTVVSFVLLYYINGVCPWLSL
ncbi:hypothetical protein, partial [Thiocapsa marina]|uniref:hypothetical protein n=1 Tax=Thiocapsa marina TaxID=244573 RepID=UPI000594F2DF